MLYEVVALREGVEDNQTAYFVRSLLGVEIEPIEAGGSRLKSSVLKVYPNEVEDNYEENHEPNQPGEVFQCGMLTTSG